MTLYYYEITDHWNPPSLTNCFHGHTSFYKGEVVAATPFAFPGKVAYLESELTEDCRWWDITGHCKLLQQSFKRKDTNIAGLNDTSASPLSQIVIMGLFAYLAYSALRGNENETTPDDEPVLNGLKRHKHRLPMRIQGLR